MNCAAARSDFMIVAVDLLGMTLVTLAARHHLWMCAFA